MEKNGRFFAQKENILFLLIICASVALYLFNINLSDIWIDDSFSKEVIKQPLANMVALVGGDFHPPLYFIGLKYFTFMTGISDFTMRLFSVLGAIGIIFLSYFAGQRAFGKKGALYLSTLLLILPMIASYSHDGRMYTWAAFFTTGIFLYSYLFIQNGKKSDLILLGIFSLAGAYTHYYCMVAAFWANLFVLIYLIKTKKKITAHLITSSAVVVLFIPWALVLFNQIKNVKHDFWVPPASLDVLFSCYINPFARKFWMLTPSIIMAVVVYGLTLISVYYIFFKSREDKKLLLGLALVIFHFTILTALVISLVFKPILYPRYIMTIIPLVMVPVALYFSAEKIKWLKPILLGVLIICGIYVSVSASYFSMGPYKQTLEYIHESYPEVKKILHVNEVTTGPMLNYTVPGQFEHYWLNNKNTIAYTNMSVFKNLHNVNSLDEMLTKDEIFCLVNFKYLTLNQENEDLVLSNCRIIKHEDIFDKKSPEGIVISMYLLQLK